MNLNKYFWPEVLIDLFFDIVIPGFLFALFLIVFTLILISITEYYNRDMPETECYPAYNAGFWRYDDRIERMTPEEYRENCHDLPEFR